MAMAAEIATELPLSRTIKKRRSRAADAKKENEVPQRGGAAQTPAQRLPFATLSAETPVPLSLAFLEMTPEAPLLSQAMQGPATEVWVDELCQRTQLLSLPEDPATHALSLTPQTTIVPGADSQAAEPAASEVAPTEPVRGLGELSQLDFWAGEMPVRNTFIEFSSPGAHTSQLSGNTEPRGFAPGAFTCNQEPEPETPVVISLQNSLGAASSSDAMPQRGRSSNRIQLNLSVWIPPVPPASRASAASEPPLPLRLAEHHFPTPAHTAPAAAAGGETVARRLFQHNSDPN